MVKPSFYEKRRVIMGHYGNLSIEKSGFQENSGKKLYKIDHLKKSVNLLI